MEGGSASPLVASIGFDGFTEAISTVWPVLSPLLLAVAAFGFVYELFSPHFGWRGTTATACVLFYFLMSMLMGFAEWQSIAFLTIGAIMVFLEIFVPGGIVGTLGLASISTGIILASNSLNVAIVSLVVSAVVAVLSAILLYRYKGYHGSMTKMILHESQSSENGFTAYTTRTELVGLTGETMTMLRTSGVAEINGERLDVVSEGAYISDGKTVKVVKAEGPKIIVREVKEKNEASQKL